MADIRPGSREHFEWLNAQMREFWNEPHYRARSLQAMGILNATTTLNQMKKETKRTTPPSVGEITAVEVTVWDNWAYNGGKKPSEWKKEPNYDKQRFKVEIEVFNQPEGEPIFGGGNASPNSIYRGTAIAFTPDKLGKYLADKREGKKIKLAWKDDAELAAFADDLDALAASRPDALIGPLCWTANGKAFVPNMAAMIENADDLKQMRVSIFYPDGCHQFTRWTTKATGGREIKGPNGEVAHQCRATNRADQSAWRNQKLT